MFAALLVTVTAVQVHGGVDAPVDLAIEIEDAPDVAAPRSAEPACAQAPPPLAQAAIAASEAGAHGRRHAVVVFRPPR